MEATIGLQLQMTIEESSMSFVRVPRRFNIEPQHMKFSVEHIAAPPNIALQRTCRIVTQFAYANSAPMRQAAELGR
jgi:hypothetical protein